MPALGKYDPLEHIPATSDTVNRYRELHDNVIQVNGYKYQFDPASRHRWHCVLMGMTEGEVISWRTADNIEVNFNLEEFRETFRLAEVNYGNVTLHNYNLAQSTKAELHKGVKYSEANIRDLHWVY